jgi:hypothetical protein
MSWRPNNNVPNIISFFLALLCPNRIESNPKFHGLEGQPAQEDTIILTRDGGRVALSHQAFHNHSRIILYNAMKMIFGSPKRQVGKDHVRAMLTHFGFIWWIMGIVFLADPKLDIQLGLWTGTEFRLGLSVLSVPATGFF